ncbi:nucleotide pyrophosphohydrolase [Aerococcus urinaehominis]|uniref:Nucleotide pyrophosphohydrolase n=1 Tax=Aerococcus urinaehominis TaxID=128944 RepID=A0A120IB46_9LACT|nr:nucleotide pyrophosphohydrolase [Aerococcus urinaehominis]AMC00016.1 nucleotide pyrophosphohydrolase [Aerococcus urinaehominis]
MNAINKFRDDRDWRQFHNEKDLALSISLEANELLEIYQWKSAEEGNQDREHLAEELADVLIYSLMLADNLGFDVDEIIQAKLVKNAQKYPVEKAKASRRKYNQL